MASKRVPKVLNIGVDSAVSDAYSGMEELKDELQNWYDNLPENFQNGDKGSQLQEAIDLIDGVSEVDVPDAASGLDAEYYEGKGTSRSARRDTYVGMLNGAADAARQRIEDLNEIEFDEDGKRVLAEGEVAAEGDPESEDERDNLVNDLETFADDAENAASEYENVEFPGMYG